MGADDRTMSRYDLVLALIPSAFVVALLVAHAASVPARTAVVAASVTGALAVCDALFLNPPRPGTPEA